MCDYISRDAAFDSLNKLCDRVCQYSNAQRYVMCSSCPLGDAFNVIEVDIPAADVRPVVRGHWISREEAEKIFEENYSFLEIRYSLFLILCLGCYSRYSPFYGNPNFLYSLLKYKQKKKLF